MPETQLKPSVYRVIIDIEDSWAESWYKWTVTSWDDEIPLWTGTAITGWGAKLQARRAVKKLRKGKSPKVPKTYPEEIYVYP